MTSNEENKAAMRDRNSTDLNKSGKEGQVVRSPNSTKPGDKAAMPADLKVDHCHPDLKR